MENGQYKLSTEHRITKLETCVHDLVDDVSEIRDNHLKHLAEKMDRIQWLLITTLIAVLVSFASKLI